MVPALHPLLQRALIALGGAVVSTGVIVKTAENKHRPAKKRRRKKTDPPVVIGTVAKREAAEDFVPSITAKDVLENIKGTGRAFLGFFSRAKKQPPKDGALEPDEVRAADGTTVKASKTSSKASSTKKPLTAAERRRRRKRRRREASLFESAKESLRQVVKEETNKAVEEKIESAGLKKAADAVKQAGDTVKEAAQKVGAQVAEQIPEDANEKLQAAGKSFLAGAKKLGQSIGSTIGQGVQQAVQALQEPPATSTPPPEPPSMTTPEPTTMTTAEPTAMTATEPPPAPASTEPSTTLTTTTTSTATPPPATLPVEPGLSADELGQKLQDGVKKVGAFLSGPGNPGYGNRRRGGGGSGDIVDAKDPDPPG